MDIPLGGFQRKPMCKYTQKTSRPLPSPKLLIAKCYVLVSYLRQYGICQVQKESYDGIGFLGDFINIADWLANWLESCMVRFHKEQACSLDVGHWMVGFRIFACIW